MTTGIDPVGIYAAIIATLAVGWRVFEWRNDRAKLKLKVSCVTKVPLGKNVEEDNKGGDYLQLKAINIGRRSIKLRCAGIDAGVPIFNIEAHKEGILPKNLAGGESISIDYERKRIQRMMLDMDIQPESMYIVDDTDRVYSKKIPPEVKRWLQPTEEV